MKWSNNIKITKLLYILLVVTLLATSFFYFGIRYIPNNGMTVGSMYYQPTTILSDKGEKQSASIYHLSYFYTYEKVDKDKVQVLTYSVTLKDAIVYVLITIEADWKITLLGTDVIYHENIFHNMIVYKPDQGENSSYSNRVILKIPDRNGELLSLSLNLFFAGDGNAKISGCEYIGRIELYGFAGLLVTALVYTIPFALFYFIFKKSHKK